MALVRLACQLLLVVVWLLLSVHHDYSLATRSKTDGDVAASLWRSFCCQSRGRTIIAVVSALARPLPPKQQKPHKALPYRYASGGGGDPLDIEKGLLAGLVRKQDQQQRANKSAPWIDRYDATIPQNQAQQHHFYIMGTDESGTGCIAGPIYVVSCCILAPLDSYKPIPGVADSKSLSFEQCQRIAQHVMHHTNDEYAYAVTVCTPSQIDAAVNVQHCILSAMADSMDRLVETTVSRLVGHSNQTTTLTPSFYSIVDGHRAPPPTMPHTLSRSTQIVTCRPWKAADATVYTVALASCVARYLHESYMRFTAHVQYPAYGFDVHGGYATRLHLAALDAHGPIRDLHRWSCQPVRDRASVSGRSTPLPVDSQSHSTLYAATSTVNDSNDGVDAILEDENIGAKTVATISAATATAANAVVDNVTRLPDRTAFVSQLAKMLVLATVGGTATMNGETANAMYIDSKSGISYPELGEVERLAVPRTAEEWFLYDVPSDNESKQPLSRLDSTSDALFYKEPRLVEHVDDTAVRQLMQYIDSVLQAAVTAKQKDEPSPSLAVLDLCASWTSHIEPSRLAALVPNRDYLRVAGLGMNAQELAANQVLTEWTVYDLNAQGSNLKLPYNDDSFDVVLCQLSIDYLVYPLAVCREMARVLRDGGSVHILFSNRLFITKAVSTWTGKDDIDHATLVASYLYNAGLFENIVARDVSLRNRQGRVVGDPVYVVSAQATRKRPL